MNRIPERTIEDIKQRLDLVALAERIGVRLREKQRGDFWGCCPFHKEKSPSFHIVRHKGFYKCFGCGASGGAVKFWQETQGLSWRDAIGELASMVGIDIDDPTAQPKDRAPVVVTQAAGPDPREQHAKRRRAFENWWQKTVPLAGSLAETYLVEARGIRHSVLKGITCLRAMPDAPYWFEVKRDDWQIIYRGPALVAAAQYPDGTFAAAHVTYLEPDGSGKWTRYLRPPHREIGDDGEKYNPKKVQGPIGGGAIRLAQPDTEMAAAEGLENALTCMCDGGPPSWGAYSVDNLVGAAVEGSKGSIDPRDRRKTLPSEVPDMERAAFAFPPVVERATLIGDGDTKDMLAHEAMLRRGVRRFQMQGIDCGYVIPEGGLDLNDLWLQQIGREAG